MKSYKNTTTENKKNINIREIAKLANVSSATVSRVLNMSENVRPETRERILEIINEYDYTPHQSISSYTSNGIAFFIGNLTNGFYSSVLKRFIEHAKQHNKYVIACPTNSDPFLEASLYEYCKTMKYSGIVLDGFTTLKQISSSIPTVILDGNDSIQGNYFNISSDNQAGIRRLVDYLYQLNHHKIGFISGGNAYSAGPLRKKIFLDYTASLKLPIPEHYIFAGDFTINSGIRAFDYFYSLPDMPTAIISANDEMARGFIIRANTLGVKIPEEISICGIDATDDVSFLPKITSMRQDVDSIAEAAFSYIQNYDTFLNDKEKIFPISFSLGDTCYKNEIE